MVVLRKSLNRNFDGDLTFGFKNLSFCQSDGTQFKID